MSNPNKSKGSRLETRVVKMAEAHGLSARRQPGSGIYADFPNDVTIENLLIEAKCGYTRFAGKGVEKSKKISVDLEWIIKVSTNAEKGQFDEGLLVIRPDGVQEPYVFVRLEYLLRVLAALKNCP